MAMVEQPSADFHTMRVGEMETWRSNDWSKRPEAITNGSGSSYGQTTLLQ